MDFSERYNDLTTKLNENLPIIAYPTRELGQVFRTKGHPVTLKTELTITSVINSGDISGIMCAVKLADRFQLACALTQLTFSKTNKLYAEIADYQKKREKRIKRLRLSGLN